MTLLRSVWNIRREKIDLMFDFEFFSKLPLIVGALGNIRQRAGFYLVSEWWRRKLLTFHGYYNHYYHVKDIFLSLVYLVRSGDPYYIKFKGYQERYLLPTITLSSELLERAREIFHTAGVDLSKRVVAINPNAGPELSPSLKKWPPEYFIDFIDKLVNQYTDVNVVLVGSLSEQLYVESIIQQIKDKRVIFNIVGQTTLAELSGILSLSHLFISIDSGPMHLASLTNTPTIGIFGSETPVLYRPLGKYSSTLCASFYSVPMYTVYNGKESLLTQNIPLQHVFVQDVLAAVQKYLN
ncbi:MAG: glycosyltransferase family 9 protein [Patescibacteria group bacterium]|nr:glycosyltransferase family 9 protein [Patescibacteria group bacterium]